MDEQNRKKDTRVEVELDGEIEIKPFDIKPFIGMKATIETVEIHYHERNDSYYMKVATNPVAYVNDEPEKPVTASKIYGLVSQDGKFGWKKDGELANFLKVHGVTKPEDLKGKEVIMLPSKPNKDGAQFLQFN